MKIRFTHVLGLALIICTMLVGTVLADGPIVYYEDPELYGASDWDTEGGEGSLITNGAFDEGWDSEGPAGWELYMHHMGGEMRFAQMEYGPDNYALGLFIRADDATYPGYGLAYQELDVPEAGYYWTVVHVTAWGKYNWWSSMYNSVAWYAIADDPMNVPEDAWRELYPDLWVCPNMYGICNHLGRYETVYVEPGQYLVLKGEMKFPDWQAWTVFGWDDISMEGPLAGEDVLGDGWWADGVITWDPHASR